jgi:hypothetical protein
MSVLAVEQDAARLEAFRDAIEAASRRHGIPRALIAAVISRETGAQPRWCKPPTLGGELGDRGHGHGPMQLDDRQKAHREMCARWAAGTATAAEMIDFCTGLLAEHIEEFRVVRENTLTPIDARRAALAGYNAGAAIVALHWLIGHDLDQPTAGHDYGRDVLAREGWLAAHGWGAT